MDSGRSTRALPRVGFPIRKSSDQRMVSSFPRLIAAAHVLHRLLAPRHPPCALVLLIRKNTFYCCYGVFKVRVSPANKQSFTRRTARKWTVSQNSTAWTSRSTYSRRARARTVPKIHQRDRTPAGVRAPAFPRKEVIQPHLPVRLPCYDFTPIIDPTFDGCLLAVSSPASGIADFRGVTGGVYKTRVRIHRGAADPRLLATPPS